MMMYLGLEKHFFKDGTKILSIRCVPIQEDEGQASTLHGYISNPTCITLNDKV